MLILKCREGNPLILPALRPHWGVQLQGASPAGRWAQAHRDCLATQESLWTSLENACTLGITYKVEATTLKQDNANMERDLKALLDNLEACRKTVMELKEQLEESKKHIEYLNSKAATATPLGVDSPTECVTAAA